MKFTKKIIINQAVNEISLRGKNATVDQAD